jgi:hypothetical protein
MHAFAYCCAIGLTIGALAEQVPLAAAEATPQPDVRQIVRAAEQTIARLSTAAASWTTVQEMEGGVEVRVQAHRAPTMQRYSVAVWKGALHQEMVSVIVRDGVWFVNDFGTRYKCRPYEGPMKNPNAYLFLERTTPRLVDAALFPSKPAFESVADGMATFRSPPTDAVRKQMETVVSSLDRLIQQAAKENVAVAGAEKLAETRRTVQDVLTRGIPVRVDLQDGLVVESGILGRRVWLRDFRWHDRIDPAVFAVDNEQWTDRTTLMTVDDPTEVVALRHSAMWQSGQPAGALESRLLNLKTGEGRRVPFAGADCVPLCFSRDRRHIYVGGIVLDAGAMGLFEINLRTLAQRRLGLSVLGRGFIISGALSPDGKTLAIAQGLAGGDIFDRQVVLVGVASGRAKNLGKPLDCGRLSWLPDGTGLVLLSRKRGQLDKPGEDRVCRMDLNGHVTPLLKGDMPSTLTPRKAVLYLADDRTWMTCDLDGRGARRVLDGLAQFNFPAPSPDGKRVLMMKFGGSDGPRPHVVDLDTGQITAIDVGPGLWTQPIWR